MSLNINNNLLNNGEKKIINNKPINNMRSVIDSAIRKLIR